METRIEHDFLGEREVPFADMINMTHPRRLPVAS
jgi:hypothetical protein